jgi:hypothetical protein
MCIKDIPSANTGSQRLSDESYTRFGVMKSHDLTGDFWVIPANSPLNNYSNNLYQEIKI